MKLVVYRVFYGAECAANVSFATLSNSRDGVDNCDLDVCPKACSLNNSVQNHEYYADVCNNNFDHRMRTNKFSE